MVYAVIVGRLFRAVHPSSRKTTISCGKYVLIEIRIVSMTGGKAPFHTPSRGLLHSNSGYYGSETYFCTLTVEPGSGTNPYNLVLGRGV